MGYIYKIVNKVTNKIYIGQTIQDLDERWRQHKKTNSNCRYLKAAIKKYGIDNFEFKLICICFDSDLDKYECYYMNKYDTIVPNGYNLRQGGNSGRHNEETKKKISETLKNRTDIIRCKIGKPHTDENKKKISESLKGFKQSQESVKKRAELLTKYKVFKLDANGTILESFNGYSEAAKSVKTSRGSIWSVCNGKLKTTKGFMWKSELI